MSSAQVSSPEPSIPRCPECGRPAPVLFRRIRSFHASSEFQIARCPHCRFGFTVPFGTDASFYSEESYGYERIKAHLFEIEYRNRDYAAWLSRLTRGRVLEIGCMFGLFLDELRRYSFDVEGIELGPQPCAETRAKGIPCFQGAVEDFAAEPRTVFDAVASFHTLEHVTRLDPFFAAVRKVLAPDGILLLAVPDFARAARWKGRWGWILAPAHQFHFTEESLLPILERHGFRPEAVERRGGDAPFYISCLYNLIGLRGGKQIRPATAKFLYRAFYHLLAKPRFRTGREELLVVSRRAK